MNILALITCKIFFCWKMFSWKYFLSFDSYEKLVNISYISIINIDLYPQHKNINIKKTKNNQPKIYV